MIFLPNLIPRLLRPSTEPLVTGPLPTNMLLWPGTPRKSPYGFSPLSPATGAAARSQHVQDVIRDAIVRLDLPPGTFIDKAALCARLGVSRFPVSEALGRLAAEGFVEVLPQRGTRVARIDLADCRQAMFIRRALEAEAMRAIAPRADAALLAALDRNLRDQEAALRQRPRRALPRARPRTSRAFARLPRLRAGEACGGSRARQPRPRAAVHVHARRASSRPSRSIRPSSCAEAPRRRRRRAGDGSPPRRRDDRARRLRGPQPGSSRTPTARDRGGLIRRFRFPRELSPPRGL